MNATSRFAAFGITFVLLCLPLHGTTCVAGKSFKVRQVCGTVTDKPGAAISDAKIELVPKGILRVCRRSLPIRKAGLLSQMFRMDSMNCV